MEAVKLRCKRCGIENEKETCELCQKENGIISQNRLENAYFILTTNFKERKHGFTIGEANNAFPYNFDFTVKILEKLRNYEILDSKSITGSKRYYFTGKKIESTHYNDKKTEKVKKMEEKPKPTCKYCGGTVRYNHIACSDCRDLWVEDVFENEIKPILTKNKQCNMTELFNQSSLKSNQTLWRLVREMINNGWVNCHEEGQLKICSLPGTEIEIKKEKIEPTNKQIVKAVYSGEKSSQNIKIPPNGNQRLRGLIINDMQTSNDEGNSIKNHLHLLNELEKIEAE